jgi:hypothetical protein
MNRISAWAVVKTEATGAGVATAEFTLVRPDVGAAVITVG